MGANFSEEYMRLLLAISEVAIVAFTDRGGRITFANKKFCEVSGYSLEELMNQDHRLLNSQFHEKEFFRNMYKTILAKEVWRGEIQNKRKDGGYYWVDTQIIPIINENGEIESFASVRFDITQRKKMEKALIQLEKMASLGEMSAVVAHEINNPLTVMQMSVDSIKKELRNDKIDGEKINSKIDKIDFSIKRMSKLVRGLKTFSRTSEYEDFVKVDLQSFVEEILAFSKCKCLGSDINFIVSDIPKIEIECRPDQISQVLINLINNAHDAVLEISEKWIEFNIHISSKENAVIFFIRDSGKGIPEHIAEKMHTPFFTTKEVGKGTGLGLSISKAIAEEHGGELLFDRSSPHTLFVLKLPIQQISEVTQVS